MPDDRIREAAKSLVFNYRDTKEDTTYIHPDTPPVLWFGQMKSARVATIGINPSKAEYFSRKNELLRGDKKRLSSWPDIRDAKPLSPEAELDAVIESCNRYFKVKPYSWFKPLDQFLINAMGNSFYDDTACHLDLFPWATTRYWGELNRNEGKAFVEAGKHFLETVLASKKFNYLLLNGRTAYETITGQFENTMKANSPLDDPALAQKVTLFSGEVMGTSCLAWSANIQSYRGKREPLIAALVNAAKEIQNA